MVQRSGHPVTLNVLSTWRLSEATLAGPLTVSSVVASALRLGLKRSAAPPELVNVPAIVARAMPGPAAMV